MSEPIRVLHVLGRMDRGGAETLIMNLYRNIDRSKVQFDFLVHTDEKCDYDDEIRSLGGRIYSVPKLRIHSYYKYIKALNDFFENHLEYKIVHGHMSSVSAVYLRIAQEHGVPVRIAHSHNTQSGGGFKGFERNILMNLLPKHVTHYFACSKPAAKWLFKKNADKAAIIKNAIDLDRFSYNPDVRQKVRNDLKIGESTFVVGHVGRFDEQKNHINVINVFSELKKIEKNAMLLLVGDGHLKTQIKDMVKKLNLQDSVRFLGVRNDVNNLMQAFDVFLFPSLYEGLGIVLIEAQAAGLHCVISDVIPQEANMGIGLIDKVSLDSDLAEWAGHLLACSHNGLRKSNCNKIKHMGYDIKDVAVKLQGFYLSEFCKNKDVKKINYSNSN